jgi:hypothetical protein
LKRLSLFAALALLVVAPCAAQSQSSMTASYGVPAGPHGYDWWIGTWACVNGMPSTALSGPKATTVVVTRTAAGGALFARTTGTDFDAAGYSVYSAKTKTWLGNGALSDGSYSEETSTGTGKTVVWAGAYYGPGSDKSTQIRDTYALLTPNKYTDLGESQMGGSWKKQYNITCTRS